MQEDPKHEFFTLVSQEVNGEWYVSDRSPFRKFADLAKAVGLQYRTLMKYVYKRFAGMQATFAARSILVVIQLQKLGKVDPEIDPFSLFLSKDEIKEVKQICNDL